MRGRSGSLPFETYLENKSTVNDEQKNILENGTAVCLHVSPASIDNTDLEVSQQQNKLEI